ncbi:Uncharacterized damage-inducible protein DinB (forms a four-helix bundle) [Gracilibacillus ureilyticus]|uniref:Uncharacterized damage-inducible protein DinB (Forms a four-helix bundle) n=1 Tax=Gracilibacillus ureilyticus TaxID=531814 RepID=A0A1H9W4E3_9BACI|nr:DinB family protein [Gracilibacillus ureilyticus]SES28654.1 Uncharacterized damage-inducible protein DinB (forms a four-helix bundle) [Gracilibacillus ureilyticus]
MKHPALKMYDYHIWANEVIMDRLKELPEDIFHKEIQSGFSSVSEVFAHIYITDNTWFEVVTGKSMEQAMISSNEQREQLIRKNLDEMKEIYQGLSEKFKTFINNEEDIDKLLLVDNPYAGKLETSISETILHIATHGAYHRGNIATMLRQVGHTSVMQDYGLYLYHAK